MGNEAKKSERPSLIKKAAQSSENEAGHPPRDEPRITPDVSDATKSSSSPPLIVKQTPKNIKGTQPLPYDFGAETYDVYSNPKNPFMERLLSPETDPLRLDPAKAQTLFRQYEKNTPYALEFPTAISAHRKRKISSPAKQITEQTEAERPVRAGTADLEYLPREKLKEDSSKLQGYIEGFFDHLLTRLRNDPGSLPLIINEFVPLFVDHKIRIRIYDAFRQIHGMEALLYTLEQISEDCELENFELFCSALFAFYSRRKT